MGLIVIDDWLLLATLLASQRMQDKPGACAGYAACASPLPSPFSSRYTNWPKSASRAFIVHLAIILCNLFSLSLIELNLQNLQLPAASPTRAVPPLLPCTLPPWPTWQQLLLWQAALSWCSPHKSMSHCQLRYLYPPSAGTDMPDVHSWHSLWTSKLLHSILIKCMTCRVPTTPRSSRLPPRRSPFLHSHLLSLIW